MFKNIIATGLILLLSISAVPLVTNANTASASKPTHTTNTRLTEKTVILSVPSMTCPVCPITVRKALEKLTGVSKVSVNFKDKIATVTFNPAKTSEKALTQATKDAGYSSVIKKPKK